MLIALYQDKYHIRHTLLNGHECLVKGKIEALHSNDDVSIWVNNSRMGRKTPKQRQNPHIYVKTISVIV